MLREFVQASVGPVSATVAGRSKGFMIVVQLGNGSKTLTLTTSRGNVRLFASLDTAAALIKDIGLSRFQVDMAGHQPGRLRSPRPDRAEALRQTRTRIQQQPLGF